jgi:hypothetical protein
MALFDRLPDKIFRPLAASNRRFYAALLLHLYEQTFDTAGGTPRKTDVINEIGDFIDRNTMPDAAFDPNLEEGDDGSEKSSADFALKDPKGHDVRRYTVYDALAASGWLVEMRDRFRKLVDLSPEGRLLLRDLSRIASGDTRSYGGAVLNVLGNLNEAIAHPDARSEHVRNAWQFSRDFMQHLRALAARMRQLENDIMHHEGLGPLFRAFFEDFVTRHLVTDYKTLYTKHNPFRLRHDILEKAREIEGNALLMSRLVEGYVREQRASDAAEAESVIRRELAEVHRIFEGIDRQLEVIDETQSRIESRIRTAIRYMDRHDGGLIERTAKAIETLGRCGLSLNGVVDTQGHVFRFEPPLGGDSLTTPRPKPAEIRRTRVRETPPDPALIAFEQAKEEYARRLIVTPQRIAAFIERALAGRDRVRADEIEIGTVDDFVVFQRLRETDVMFDGLLAGRWQVLRSEVYTENDWEAFPDFEIVRVACGQTQAEEADSRPDDAALDRPKERVEG